MSKQITWDQKLSEVSNWADLNGVGMDTRVIELVTALNLLNIETLMSCEGHIEDGTLPSITIKKENCDKSYEYLVKFYNQRSINPNSIIILNKGPHLGILMIHNLFLQTSRNTEEKIFCLEEAQNEFQLFGKFLKNEFLK